MIFVYYVLIRLGEQAGDTGLMAPLVAVWAANVVLGAAGVTLLYLNYREAAFDPLDPRHYSGPAAAHPHAQGAASKAARGGHPRPGPAPRRVVVVRIPRLSLPIPGLIDRYIVRTYIAQYALVLTAFWAIFVLVSFMDLFDDIQQNKVKGMVVFHYYTFFTPSIAHLLTPVAVLVAVLITFGVMARHNEITAMKAAGLSIYRIVFPALALSALICFGMFEVAEYLLPPLNKRANQDKNVIKGRPPQSSSTQRAPLDPGQRRTDLQLRLPAARRRDGRSADLALRPLHLRRGSPPTWQLTRPALRRAGGLERRRLQPRARLALVVPAARRPSTTSRRPERGRSRARATSRARSATRTP